MWQELVKVLGKLADAYERLLELARRKRAALVAVDMEALERLIEEENGIIDEIQHLEFGRQQILGQLSRELPEFSDGATMEDVARHSPDDIRPWLNQLHKRLDEAVSRTKEAGEANEFLIRSALSAVKYHLNRLGNSVVEPAYGGKGEEVVSRQKNFDFRA